MATLIELQSAGQLFKIDPALRPREQESRIVYVVPQLRAWIENTLPGLGSTWKIDQTPNEQLDACVATFCSGTELTYGEQFKPLTHLRDGIWELKTADLRMFGWFPQIDCFVGTDADLADRIKQSRMYKPYCQQAVRRRDTLDLDEPKYIQGKEPHDVVSNYSFS